MDVRSDYCRDCDGYAAETGKPGEDGRCPQCHEIAVLRLALQNACDDAFSDGPAAMDRYISRARRSAARPEI